MTILKRPWLVPEQAAASVKIDIETVKKGMHR
jgi:hypothetical protein